MNIAQTIGVILGAYGVGSIPTGYLIARMRGIADIRQHGSGNIGATNVARFLGWPYFVLVFTVDSLKAYAYLCGLMFMNCSETYLIACGLFLLLGNAFPWYLGFKGGKGVATTVGVLLAFNIKLVLCSMAVWGLSFTLTRTVGISSVITCVALPFIVTTLHHSESLLFFSGFISVAIVFLHRKNMSYFFNNKKV